MGKKVNAFWLSLVMVLGFIVIVDVTTDFTLNVGGGTLFVNTTGIGGAYTKIQDAINDSKDGDTVFVYNGTYTENVILNKTINLTGEDRDGTKIDGGGSGNVVYINVNWVNITGFTITNGTYGMWLDSSSNNSIINNNIKSNRGLPAGFGIVCDSSSNNIITNNIVSNNGNGIVLGLSSNNIIEGNDISSNDDAGVWFDVLSNSTIADNKISMNGGYGLAFVWSSNNTITGNNVFSNGHHGFYLSSSLNNMITGNNVSSNGQYGIYLSSSSNNTITGNNLSPDNLVGVYLSSSSNNTIKDNDIISNDQYGIYLLSSSNNTITGNFLQYDGIHLESSQKNDIINNEVLGVPYGILLESQSTNNKIKGNYIDGCDFGIRITTGNEPNMITENTIYSNNGYGIILEFCYNNIVINNYFYWNVDYALFLDWAYNSIIKNNFFEYNNYGIYFYRSHNNNITDNTFMNNGEVSLPTSASITLAKSSDNNFTGNTIATSKMLGINISDSSDNNVFHHNNIINNPYQVVLDNGTCSGNVWDDGNGEGNYWSDYNGLDDGSGGRTAGDGVGDTLISHPYTDQGNGYYQLDNFPLMKPAGIIFLYEGWNLISIPSNQNDTDLRSVLSSISGMYDAVQWYNASDTSDTWKHYQISKPPQLNDLNDIDHTIGFWIHIIKPGGIYFQYLGNTPTTSQKITLYTGWNLVGYPSLTNYNRTVGLNNLTFYNEVDAIWTYHAATQKWEEIGPSDYFELGRGYWIHATTKCEWKVPL